MEAIGKSVVRLALGLLLGLSSANVSAAWVLSHQGVARAGESIDIDVLYVNDARETLIGGLPRELPARLVLGARSIDATLTAASPLEGLGDPIAPGAFRRHAYRLSLPLDATGNVSVQLIRALGPQVLVAVEAPRSPPPAPASNLAAIDNHAIPPDRNVRAAEAALSAHEPMYFIVGTRETTSAKMQLSFKYRLLDEETWLGHLFPPLAKLHFGYTQTSIWDIGRDSAPFRDTSYRPSLFFYEPQAWQSSSGRQSLSFSAGLEHESNGKDAGNSRSMNIAFIRPRWRYALDDGYFIRFDPKLYTYLERSDNRDIARYRGYGDFGIGFGHTDEWLANTTIRKGSGSLGSLQIDLSYRIRQRVFANASGFVYLQFFNGYGESLLDYDVHRRSQVRLGFAIVR